MKFLAKAFLPLWLGLVLSSSAARAQVNIRVTTPGWGPAVGPGVQYYYIPEIDGYYDLYTQSYVYIDNGYWVSAPVLPPWYAHYNPRYFHPVVVSYVGRQPWGYIRDHRARYPRAVAAGPGRYVVPGPGRHDNAGPGRQGYVAYPAPQQPGRGRTDRISYGNSYGPTTRDNSSNFSNSGRGSYANQPERSRGRGRL